MLLLAGSLLDAGLIYAGVMFSNVWERCTKHGVFMTSRGELTPNPMVVRVKDGKVSVC